MHDPDPLMTFERSRELLAKARTTTPGGVHSNVRLWEQPWPLFFESASGSRLRDVDGNELIDYVLGQGPMILGHNPPEVVEAVSRQLQRGVLFGGQHELEISVAEKLVQMIPSAERVRFNSTGTEAVLSAIRIARAATGRTKVLKFQGHYNGWADSVLYNTSSPSPAHTSGGLLRPVPESPGVAASVADDLLVTEWNDSGAVEEILSRHHDEVAAVLMEPIMGNSGVIEPEPNYLHRVRSACSRYGAVLIFDEIISGFRAGPGGAQGRYGVNPDLSVFGKALASGFPVSCVVGRKDLFAGVDAGDVMHAGTFNGNPIGMGAALATLNVLSDQSAGVYARLERAGAQLRDGIAELASTHKAQILVQGIPSLFAISFTKRHAIRNHSEAGQSDMAALRRFIPHLLRRGVRIAGRGNWFLSAAHSNDDVDQTLFAFEGALKAYSQATEK